MGDRRHGEVTTKGVGVRVGGILYIVGGVVILIATIPWAVALARPPQSSWGRRWFGLPWANDDLPAQKKRRKQVLHVAGMSIYGLAAVLQGLVMAFRPQSDLLSWLFLIPIAISVVCILAALSIRPETR